MDYGCETAVLRRNLDASQPRGSRDPAPPLLRAAQARLSFGLLTQFLTRGPNGPQRGGPKSATTVQFTTSASQNSSLDSCPRLPVHAGTLSAFSLWLRILKMSISLLPSHLPSLLLTYLSSRLLSYLSSKIFFSRSHSEYLHPRMQNSAHHEHQAGKRTLERTQSRRADRDGPKG
jgi:hypothetical protein